MNNATFQLARDMRQAFFFFSPRFSMKYDRICKIYIDLTFYYAKYCQWINLDNVVLDLIAGQCSRYYLIPLIISPSARVMLFLCCVLVLHYLNKKDSA